MVELLHGAGGIIFHVGIVRGRSKCIAGPGFRVLAECREDWLRGTVFHWVLLQLLKEHRMTTLLLSINVVSSLLDLVDKLADWFASFIFLIIFMQSEACFPLLFVFLIPFLSEIIMEAGVATLCLLVANDFGSCGRSRPLCRILLPVHQHTATVRGLTILS